jgi:serine/threonine protein kinase
MARDDFEIVDEKPIGCGQFGTVFRARRRRDGRATALKLILRRGQSGADTIEAERRGATLQQEFQSRHGMVPEVFEFGPDDEDFFIAMELVEGPSLEERLRDGALAYDEAIGHARWMCEFLHAAHAFSPIVDGRQFRLLHNDLKPAHLKIPEQGERKVLDFGIAKALEESRELATDVGRTIAYAAPERLLSERVNVHADFWSLGVMLYEMASGHRPYPHLEGPRHRRSLYTAITTNEARAALPRDCPLHLQAIVNRLLAFQPEHRYQTAAEIRADLDRYIRGETPEAAAYYDTPATMPVSRERVVETPATDIRPNAPVVVPLMPPAPPIVPVPAIGSMSGTSPVPPTLGPGSRMPFPTIPPVVATDPVPPAAARAAGGFDKRCEWHNRCATRRGCVNQR